MEGWGADWRFYGEDDLGSYYYDVKSITRPSNNVVSLSEKMVFTEKGAIEVTAQMGEKFKGLSYSIALFEHDCVDKKFHVLEMVGYSKGGKVLFRLEIGNITKWENIAPGSVGEKLYKIICKQPK